jgi:hypothetical protein
MLFAKNLEIVLHLLRQIVEPMLSFHMLFPWKTPGIVKFMRCTKYQVKILYCIFFCNLGCSSNQTAAPFTLEALLCGWGILWYRNHRGNVEFHYLYYSNRCEKTEGMLLPISL